MKRIALSLLCTISLGCAADTERQAEPPTEDEAAITADYRRRQAENRRFMQCGVDTLGQWETYQTAIDWYTCCVRYPTDWAMCPF